jgi:hypothetical protein
MNAPPRAVIFAGPSLPPAFRPDNPALEWRPPVRQGEVYEAALTRPAIIGIIDGYFEVTPRLAVRGEADSRSPERRCDTSIRR